MTRLSKALNSSDLGHYHAPCDADVLQASGLTAIHRTLGVLIIEAREGSAGDGPHSAARVRDLVAGLKPAVQRVARRWRIRVDLAGVAYQVARELILDRCHVCQGRGFIPMRYDGTRMVAVSGDQDGAQDVDCGYCLGSGQARRDYHARARAAGFVEYTRQLGEWWEAVLQTCCDAEIDARRVMAKKLQQGA